MSSIILERNGVIEVILCSSHQAETLSRPSNKYPRSFCPAMVASLRRSRSVQPEGFDLNKFKSTRAVVAANVETLLTALPIHSIAQAKDFVRLHPNENEY